MNRQQIQQAEILISAVEAKQYPTSKLPEVALAGRSNVGKSSLINKLTGRRRLARTSSRPGRTRTINFYDIEGELVLVDVPGYGYAKVSKQEQNKWAQMMEEYFELREELAVALLVIDFRHAPTQLDQQMYHYLKSVELPVIVVATKADKVKRGQWQKHEQQVLRKIPVTHYEEDELLLFSAETGWGVDRLWDIIFEYTEIEEE